MKMGISIFHGETMNLEKHMNFDLFFDFLFKANITCEAIKSKFTTIKEIINYPSIMIGAPEENFSDQEFSVLRQYVSQGGNLMIILKFGGNELLHTNIGNLFSGISPFSDILVNERTYHAEYIQPLIDMSIKTDCFNFEGRICYDGGCTFSVEDIANNDGFIYYPDSNSYSTMTSHKQDDRYIFGRQREPGAILVYRKIGNGSVLYWGSRWSFSNEIFNLYDNTLLCRKLLELLFPGIYKENLEHRLSLPQRHRLLHGYPMSDGMKKHDLPIEWKLSRIVRIDDKKPIAVGVIPHPFCNPSITGCGFCTFPHEKYNSEIEKQCVESVISEIEAITKRYRGISRRDVSSVYFGGGTANMIDNDLFLTLCDTIKSRLNISTETEITLEGAPFYFSSKPDLLNIMKESFPGSKLRISIGVQTFDKNILEMMGRSVLNQEGSLEKTLSIARSEGINVSVDFLFNLPCRKFEDIGKDVETAISIGIEHICFYNLVCFKGLGTRWSELDQLLKTLPDKNESLDNFLSLYELMRENNYYPLTVTDFSLKNSGKNGRYIYEEDLREPEKKDWIGFGPYAISMFSGRWFKQGIKLMNPTGSSKYINAQKQYAVCWDKSFRYIPEDLKIFWITRKIKGTKIPLHEYKDLFGNDIMHDFPLAVEALFDKGLLEKDGEYFSLTPTGMHFADSVAGIFSWMRVNELTIHEMNSPVYKNYSNISLLERMG